MEKINKGCKVKSDHGFIGFVIKVYKNWDDLKSKNRFYTIDADGDSEKMSELEKTISGDPKDKWLTVQEHPFTEKELNERWFTVKCLDGGAIWSCENRLKIIEQINN